LPDTVLIFEYEFGLFSFHVEIIIATDSAFLSFSAAGLVFSFGGSTTGIGFSVDWERILLIRVTIAAFFFCPKFFSDLWYYITMCFLINLIWIMKNNNSVILNSYKTFLHQLT